MARWGDEGRWEGEERWGSGRRDELRPGERRTYAPARGRGEHREREGWRGSERWSGEERGERGGSDDWIVEPGWTKHDEDRGTRGGEHRGRDEGRWRTEPARGERAGWYGAAGEGWRGGGQPRGGERWRGGGEDWRGREHGRGGRDWRGEERDEHRRDYSGLSAGYGAEGGHGEVSPYRDEEWRSYREAERGYGAQARHYGDRPGAGREQHGPDYGERSGTRAWTGTSEGRSGRGAYGTGQGGGAYGGGWQADRDRGREGWRTGGEHGGESEDRWRGHDSDQGWGSSRGEDYRGFFGPAPGMYSSNVGHGRHLGETSHGLGEHRGGEREHGRSAREGGDDRGTLEKLGDKVKHGFQRLTGKPPKNYRRSDERIREDVFERLAQADVDASEVDVIVKDGEVTLSGTAPDRDDKRRIEDVAEDVFGVQEVHNHIRVNRGGTYLPAGSGQGTSGVAGTASSGLSPGTAVSTAGSSSTPQTSGEEAKRSDPSHARH